MLYKIILGLVETWMYSEYIDQGSLRKVSRNLETKNILFNKLLVCASYSNENLIVIYPAGFLDSDSFKVIVCMF